MKKLFNKVRNDQWEEDDLVMTIIARFGTGGGNVPIVLEGLPFDTTQITSPGNWSSPNFGDPCHPLAAGMPPTVVIREKMSYQRIVGTMNPGAHPGSYNGQDAYNDLLVIDNEIQNDSLHRGGRDGANH